MPSITQADKAWMAAIVDYKAAFAEKRNATRATPQLVMRVDTMDLTIVQRICNLTEIVPFDKLPKRNFYQRGCKDHCPEPHIHHEETWAMPQTAQWAATGVP